MAPSRAPPDSTHEDSKGGITCWLVGTVEPNQWRHVGAAATGRASWMVQTPGLGPEQQRPFEEAAHEFGSWPVGTPEPNRRRSAASVTSVFVFKKYC
jgi:hypothetical protein